MKDKNGIEVFCFNCDECARNNCFLLNAIRNPGSSTCVGKYFKPSYKAYEARIAELEKKLTETIKLLSERSRECGKLQALLDVKNRSDMSTQSTDAADVSKKIREMDMSNIWWR